jgi:HD-like signal output (HDOD) protein
MAIGFLKKIFKSPEDALKASIGTYELPSFPKVGREVLTMLQDPEVQTSKVLHTLQSDPGLVARVLKAVNSATFATRRPVETLAQAVSMLGLNELESLVVSATVPALVNSSPLPKAAMHDFWAASARRAFVARGIAERRSPARAPSSYVAALLQDMALPFLVHHRQEQYGPMLQDWRSGDLRDLVGAERDAFGWDHSTVAGWMCEVWRLPESLRTSIVNHHEAEGAPTEVHAVSHLPEGVPVEDCEPACSAVSSALGGTDEDMQSMLQWASQMSSELSASLMSARQKPQPRARRA